MADGSPADAFSPAPDRLQNSCIENRKNMEKECFDMYVLKDATKRTFARDAKTEQTVRGILENVRKTATPNCAR